mmetsp:Transcript_41989/g.100922  ORF Transcript_41989/g.100922 Transcript_41989/m.100922 type:complete len:710 (-) Transcript_41989:1089-3218(-)
MTTLFISSLSSVCSAVLLLLLLLSTTTLQAVCGQQQQLEDEQQQPQQQQFLRRMVGGGRPQQEQQQPRLQRNKNDKSRRRRRRIANSDGNTDTTANSLRPNSLIGRRHNNSNNNGDGSSSSNASDNFLQGGFEVGTGGAGAGGMDTVSKMQQQQQLLQRHPQSSSSSSQPEQQTPLATSTDIASTPQTRIVGGTTSSPGQFPYFVDIAGCGASLISPSIVLSAAHCSDTSAIAKGVIRVGAYNYKWSDEDGSTFAAIEEVITHPDYDDRTVANDVMLIKLTEPVLVDTTRRNSILRLPPKEEQPSFRQANTPLTVLGIGTLAEGEGFPTALQHVDVQTIDDDVCTTNYRNRGAVVLTDVMFCAGVPEGGKDSCQGDSGGPIVKIADDGTHTQVGVTSWGIGCALEGYPGVYADLSVGMDWIESVVCDPTAGWDRSAPFCNSGTPGIPVPSIPAPTAAPTQAITAAPTPAPTPAPVATAVQQRRAAQYVLYMEHYTDNLDPFGIFNSPTYYPFVRYTCKGTFRLVALHPDIQNNPKVTCVDYSDEEGFTGLECQHACDDCSYWWNNDDLNFAEFWDQAGVWFECSGVSTDDLEGKFEWVDQGNAFVDLPQGLEATNAKLARLAVRNDYSKSDDQLIAEGTFPPTDRSKYFMSFADSNPSTSIFLSETGAQDGGYIAWTGVSLCTGVCDIDFANFVITSTPTQVGFPTKLV